MALDAVSDTPITTKKPDDPKAAEAWDQAVQQAQEAGISWERPKDDHRSAQEIIDDSALFKNLGNQSGVKDMLRERVGDFEHDPDAAYRGEQVLEHIERFDENGGRIAGNDVANGRVDGFTKSGEAKHGTEAGRLQDFGKYGFSNLKGELHEVANAGDNSQNREKAERVGIVWERPATDKRSAEEIIEDNPLLKDLGNQSGVKDMLKEQVGDFEHDADAAYRAAQVLDRVTMFDENGKALSGGDVFNSRVDGFTKSGEAKHGTEAGRLQDFGKYGFEALKGLPSNDSIASYKDFLKANPDADAGSKQIALYAAILGENLDAIKGKTGGGDYLTPEAIKQYLGEHSEISDQTRQALEFWAQPGAFDLIDNAKNPLQSGLDGQVGKDDIDNWLKTTAPKDATSLATMLSTVADGNLLDKVDTGKLNQDVFEHPENYSAEEKAAVLQDLQAAQQLIIQGADAGMFKDDKSQVTIANRVRSHPDPQKLLDDVNKHIETLQQDPEVAKFLSENGSSELEKLVAANPGLRDAVQKTFDDEVKTGKTLDKLWDARSKDGKTDQQAVLAEYYGTAQTLQGALGGHDGAHPLQASMGGLDAAAIQEGVKNSKHNGELQDYYEHSLASGDRLKELLKDHSFEEASSVFTMEVSLYNAALDPDFTGKLDKTLNDNYTDLAQDNLLKDASFDDLKKAFGKDGGDELDEAKVKAYIEQVSKDNPELLLNQDGTVATSDQVVATFRGDWDLLRQGTKTLDKLDLFKGKDSDLKAASDKGVLHGVSGLFLAGVTIARGANAAGKPLSDKQIVDITTGSVQTATILAEGGLKNFGSYLKGVQGKLSGPLATDINSLLQNAGGKQAAELNKKFTDNVKKLEEAAKGVGGLAGVAAGAYGIFDGVQAIRRGDTVSGAISITAGSLGTIAGLASTVEAGLGLGGQAVARIVPATVARIIPVFAGVLGFATAGFAALATLIPGLVEEGKQETRVGQFADVLSDHLTRYEIDGVENGDIWDIPDDEWPGEDSTIAS